MGDEWGPNSAANWGTDWSRSHPEDKSFWSQDIWTIILEHNVTAHRVIVWQPSRMAVIAFGTVLSTVSLALGMFVLVTLCRARAGRGRRHEHGRHEYRAGCAPVCVLQANLVLAAILTGAVCVPFTIHLEVHGSWQFGVGWCHAWLFTRLAVAALSPWAVVAIVVDRLIWATSPRQYDRRVGPRGILALLTLTWLGAGGACVPAAWLLHAQQEDAVMVEVCAMAVDTCTTLAVTVVSFVAPVALSLAAAAGLVVITLRRHDAERMGDAVQACCPAESEEDEDTKITIGTTAAYAGCLAVCQATLGAPFYVMSVMASRCVTPLCVNPTLWTLAQWLALASAGLLPALLFVDPKLRGAALRFISCGCRRAKYEKSATVWQPEDILELNSYHTKCSTKWCRGEEADCDYPY